LRSNPRLNRATWLKCNYGTTPDQPEFKVCDYVNIEFFIPTISPARLCPNKVSLWDRWFAPGTKKITLTDAASYEELSGLARVRWDIRERLSERTIDAIGLLREAESIFEECATLVRC
jgi:hypothetical protein